MKGIVYKKNADKFSVYVNEKTFVLTARKNLKDQGVFVGDVVDFDENENIINKIFDRKNLLVRPPIANLDKMFIVICEVPKPDLYLVDKMILFCFIYKIQPILVINKCDENSLGFVNEIENIYKNVLKIIKISAKTQNFEDFLENLEGVCTLAGQSAVGKSSIINAIFNENLEVIGDLSKKVDRGKQTTRIVTLYKFDKNKYLADTAGFSKLDERLIDIDYHDLKNYYPDFLEISKGCKYRTCMHETKKDCNVFLEKEKGNISKIRYENYIKLLNVLKNIKRY